jgi:hypothetical protein
MQLICEALYGLSLRTITQKSPVNIVTQPSKRKILPWPTMQPQQSITKPALSIKVAETKDNVKKYEARTALYMAAHSAIALVGHLESNTRMDQQLESYNEQIDLEIDRINETIRQCF